MKKILALLLAAALLCACFAGCAKSPDNKDDSSTPEVRTVVDMAGNTVELPAKVDKVFCDWASGITLIMTLGATNKLAAKVDAFESDTFAWAREICPAINDVPVHQEAFTNVESALNLEPDLVVTNNKDNIEIYTNLGLTVIYVNYNSNESFMESMKIVGTALGEKEAAAAQRYNDYFNANVKMVTDRLGQIAEADRPSVYYMDSRFGDVYHTVGRGEIQEEWITAAGAALATAADFEGRNLEITAEKLLTIDPEYILIGAQKQADVYDQLMVDPLLTGLSAIKNNKVYRIPQGIFPWCRTGPEAAIQVIWAAKLLYPDRFEDVDMAATAKSFYKEFYGYDVSDDVIGGIMAGKLCPNGK